MGKAIDLRSAGGPPKPGRRPLGERCDRRTYIESRFQPAPLARNPIDFERRHPAACGPISEIALAAPVAMRQRGLHLPSRFRRHPELCRCPGNARRAYEQPRRQAWLICQGTAKPTTRRWGDLSVYSAQGQQNTGGAKCQPEVVGNESLWVSREEALPPMVVGGRLDVADSIRNQAFEPPAPNALGWPHPRCPRGATRACHKLSRGPRPRTPIRAHRAQKAQNPGLN